MSSRQTPSQTVGPFFAYGLTAQQYGYRHAQIAEATITDESGDGEAISIVGQVFDGQGMAIGDAMVEFWQADSAGRYAHAADGRPTNSGFSGFARVGTGADAAQSFRLETVKPGSVDGAQAPHINVTVFMRGLLNHCFTRIYFSDEAEANAADPVLLSVPTERRETLVATRQDTPRGAIYRFDIRMQGERETVFFDL